IKIYDQLLDKRLRPSSYMAPAAASANTPSYLPPPPQQQQPQPQPGYAPSPSAQSVVQYQAPAADHMYGQGGISTPYNVQNPEQQAQVVPQPTAQTPQYMAQPQQHQQQQIPQQQHSFTAISAPPSSQAVYPASPGYPLLSNTTGNRSNCNTLPTYQHNLLPMSMRLLCINNPHLVPNRRR
ncbi:hypothetical protein LPJ57_003373, partial [Coemansia sp. RSA 486]